MNDAYSYDCAEAERLDDLETLVHEKGFDSFEDYLAYIAELRGDIQRDNED